MNIKGEKVKQLPVFPQIVESRPGHQRAGRQASQAVDVTLCMKNYMGVIGQASDDSTRTSPPA